MRKMRIAVAESMRGIGFGRNISVTTDLLLQDGRLLSSIRHIETRMCIWSIESISRATLVTRHRRTTIACEEISGLVRE